MVKQVLIKLIEMATNEGPARDTASQTGECECVSIRHSF